MIFASSSFPTSQLRSGFVPFSKLFLNFSNLSSWIFTVSVLLPDTPGQLTKVSAVVAEMQGNVIKLEHNQFVNTNRNKAVELKITMEAFGTEHKNQIVDALEKEGYKPRLIRPNL